MMRLLFSLLLPGLFMLALPACASPYPSHYSAETIEARVVDAETKKPIEGVIITANWQLLGGMEGSLPLAQMQVLETQTDADGVFRFPAWGPLKRPKGYLRESDPQLLLFKSGYEYKRLANKVSSKINHDTIRRSDWNGKTIEMKPFKGTGEEYARHLGSINNDLYPLLGSETCDWKKVPRLLLALTEQSRTFRKGGIDSLYDVNLYLPVNERKCGSPKVFFEAYRP